MYGCEMFISESMKQPELNVLRLRTYHELKYVSNKYAPIISVIYCRKGMKNRRNISIQLMNIYIEELVMQINQFTDTKHIPINYLIGIFLATVKLS